MGRTQDRKSGATTQREFGCYKPSLRSSVPTWVLFHSVPFLVLGPPLPSVPLIGGPRIHLICMISGARWAVTWWLNCYCSSSEAAGHQSLLPILCSAHHLAPVSGSLFVTGSHRNPLKDVLTLLCKELPLKC